jgi:hypothetical protein
MSCAPWFLSSNRSPSASPAHARVRYFNSNADRLDPSTEVTSTSSRTPGAGRVSSRTRAPGIACCTAHPNACWSRPRSGTPAGLAAEPPTPSSNSSRPRSARADTTGERSLTSGKVDAIGTPGACGGDPSPSRVCAFSRTGSCSTWASNVTRSTTRGNTGASPAPGVDMPTGLLMITPRAASENSCPRWPRLYGVSKIRVVSGSNPDDAAHGPAPL